MSGPARGPRVAVVGGGITGLAAAHRLHELARERGETIDVRVYEAGERAGGSIRTERRDGFLLECGPDQFVLHKPAALDLCRRLGLDDEIVQIDARQTMTHLVHRGRPVRLPEGFTMMGAPRLRPLLASPLFSWRGLLRMACEPLVGARPAWVEDESLRSFVTRRFGRELHDRVFEPILAGMFTADSDRLSLDMTIPHLLQIEREHGSVVRGMRRRSTAAPRPAPGEAKRRGGCVSLRGGLGRIVERLLEKLPQGSVRAGCPVEFLTFDDSIARWRLTLPNDETAVDAVILACPGPASSRLVSWDAELSRDLARVDYASCATVNLVYPESALGKPLDSFGFFVGRAESLPILACSHVSVKFPDRARPGHVLLRAFLGGARDPQVMQLDQADLIRVAHRNVAALLGLRGEPLFSRAMRYATGMPQYDVGYRKRMNAMIEGVRRHPGLYLAGGVTGAIGLPDCIASGESIAGEVLEIVPRAPAVAEPVALRSTATK